MTSYSREIVDHNRQLAPLKHLPKEIPHRPLVPAHREREIPRTDHNTIIRPGFFSLFSQFDGMFRAPSSGSDQEGDVGVVGLVEGLAGGADDGGSFGVE